MVKPINNRAWFFVLPVLAFVLFSSIIPMMTVVNYSIQDTLGENNFFWNGDGWFRDLLNPTTEIGARFNDALFRTLAFSFVCLLIEVPLGIAMIWLGQYYSGLPWLVNLPLTLLATVGAAMIQFFFCFTLAMIAFWILDIGSITFIIYSVEFLLGGHIFPVDAFPAWLQAICLRLPFTYETYFPAAILIGRVHGQALATGFLWQWAWVGFFYVLSGVLWKRGLHQYTAVGG